MLSNKNFNSSSLGQNSNSNNEVETVEKVHYLGELRIIGQVVNSPSDKSPVGYVVMIEKTRKAKMYTVNQTMQLLCKFKFVNAELSGGQIVNTECAMSRMPKYLPNMNVIANYGVIILGEIVENGKTVGYRAIDCNGMVADLGENDIIALKQRGTDVINAKLVSRGNSVYVSAIKNEFTKIEKTSTPVATQIAKETAESKWIKSTHVKKWIDYGCPHVLKAALSITAMHFVNDVMYSRYSENSGVEGRYFDFNREIKILSKEVFTEKNGFKLSDEDKEIFTKAVRMLKGRDRLVFTSTEWTKMNNNENLLMLAMCQFLLTNGKQREKFVSTIMAKPYRYDLDNYYTQLKSLGLASKVFEDTIEELQLKFEKYHDDIDVAHKKYEDIVNKKAFKTTRFVTAEEIAQLGFAITPQNSGFKFETDCGYHKTLLYLGDIIVDGNYDIYKEKARCLGDLAAIANIEKLLNGNTKGYNISDNDAYSIIEMIIAISYIYGSESMRLYVENNREALQNNVIYIPDFDEVSTTDYKLSKELKLYYASGFNVFLNDYKYCKNGYVGYTGRRWYNERAELMNYRQYGNKHFIKHPLLTSELATVVNMITSDNCSAKTVDKYIGTLRFI